jgi:hypothetical protein
MLRNAVGWIRRAGLPGQTLRIRDSRQPRWPLRPEAKFIHRQAGPIRRLACRDCPWVSVEVRLRTWRSSPS